MSATYAPAGDARALPLLIAIYGLLMVADLFGWIDLPRPPGPAQAGRHAAHCGPCLAPAVGR
jgi:hypothetical protein